MIRCERDQRIQGSQRIREKANEACCKFESEQKVSLGFRGCKLLMTAICVRVKLKDSDRVTILLQMDGLQILTRSKLLQHAEVRIRY